MRERNKPVLPEGFKVAPCAKIGEQGFAPEIRQIETGHNYRLIARDLYIQRETERFTMILLRKKEAGEIRRVIKSIPNVALVKAGGAVWVNALVAASLELDGIMTGKSAL